MKRFVLFMFVALALSSCGQEFYGDSSDVSDNGVKKNATPPIEYISIKARKILTSPTYWTSTDGEFYIKYTNKAISKYSKLKLHYGVKRLTSKAQGKVVTSDWQDIKTLSLYPHEKEINVWNLSLKEQLLVRGNDHKVVGIQFVFIIETPEGHTYYDKGSDTQLGYYEADTSALLDLGYTNPQEFLDINVKIVEKSRDSVQAFDNKN